MGEAWERGATEVCLQGGIHPSFDGDYYRDVVRAIKDAVPGIHVHAFSALEIWQGAATLGLPLDEYLAALRDDGLSSLPGTAAEVLDDEIRRVICPDKVTTDQWLEVHDTAHRAGLTSNNTIMFGHVDGPVNWARHLLRVREQQAATGGFTEFVPLPFVHMEAPMYLKGLARQGPTFGEFSADARGRRGSRCIPWITNVQVSWVKAGPGRRRGGAASRRQRPRRDADERVDLARSRGRLRPGDAARADGGADPRGRARAASADDDVRRARSRAGRCVVRRRAARRAAQPAGRHERLAQAGGARQARPCPGLTTSA